MPQEVTFVCENQIETAVAQEIHMYDESALLVGIYPEYLVEPIINYLDLFSNKFIAYIEFSDDIHIKKIQNVDKELKTKPTRY